MTSPAVVPSRHAPAPTPTNARRDRILEAARRCFAGDGFRNATIIDVAKAAGVSRPLVYKYFGDKDGLIDAVLQATFDEWSGLNASLLAVSPDDSTSDPARAIERKFAAAIEFVRERPVFRAILLHDPQIVVRGHLDQLRRCRSVSLASTREILVVGIGTGAFRNDLDIETVAASLEMTLFSLLQRALGLHPELGLEHDLAATTVALILGGLRPE